MRASITDSSSPMPRRAVIARSRRFDFAPLEQYCTEVWPDPDGARQQIVDNSPDTVNGTLAARYLALILGVSDGAVWRYRREGFSESIADKLCCRINRHPAMFWPEWWGDDDDTTIYTDEELACA